MASSKANIRYARALFNFGKEQNVNDTLYTDMQFVIDTTAKNREFKHFLSNPTIHIKHKIGVVNEIFTDRVHPISINFMLLLLKKSREANLVQIARQFVTLYRRDNKISRAVVRTPQIASELFLKKLRSKLEAQTHSKIELVNKIAPSLIGGFTLQIHDLFLDLSIAGELNKLKKEMHQTAYTKKL
ncbi:MAG: ATP synthase F1 subunit delta [Bacteroidales bacterium]